MHVAPESWADLALACVYAQVSPRCLVTFRSTIKGVRRYANYASLGHRGRFSAISSFGARDIFPDDYRPLGNIVPDHLRGLSLSARSTRHAHLTTRLTHHCTPEDDCHNLCRVRGYEQATQARLVANASQDVALFCMNVKQREMMDALAKANVSLYMANHATAALTPLMPSRTTDCSKPTLTALASPPCSTPWTRSLPTHCTPTCLSALDGWRALPTLCSRCTRRKRPWPSTHA